MQRLGDGVDGLADDVVVNDGPLAAVDAAIGRLHERYLSDGHMRANP